MMVVNVLLRPLLLLLSAVVIVDVSGDGLAAVVVDDEFGCFSCCAATFTTVDTISLFFISLMVLL